MRKPQILSGRKLVAPKALLLDFGGRAADVRAARERLLAANLGFNARHLVAIGVAVQ